VVLIIDRGAVSVGVGVEEGTAEEQLAFCPTSVSFSHRAHRPLKGETFLRELNVNQPRRSLSGAVFVLDFPFLLPSNGRTRSVIRVIVIAYASALARL
jgi:hypothetical protein